MNTYTLCKKSVNVSLLAPFLTYSNLLLKCAHFKSKYANKNITFDGMCKSRKCSVKLL